MNSANNTAPRKQGKPDLSVLNTKNAMAFIEKGHDEGSGEEQPSITDTPISTPASEPISPPALSVKTEESATKQAQVDAYAMPARITKIPVSLRLPQTMTDKIMELAAEETLKTKNRVTPHDIYLRAINLYLSTR